MNIGDLSNRAVTLKFFKEMNDSTYILNHDELETILSILVVDHNYCLDKDESISSFSIYNLHNRSSIKNHEPELRINDANLNGTYKRRFEEFAMSERNLIRTDITGLGTRRKYYTQNGDPLVNPRLGLQMKRDFL